MSRSSPLRTLAIVLAAFAVLNALPAMAQAHGPTIPVATDYLARIEQAPAGLQAQVLDGDLTMWMAVPPSITAIVLDYRGAPYIRFSRAGVQVNRNSEMYYLNALPLPQTPPDDLTAATPPSWQTVSSGHAYRWHDSRLSALADIVLQPGASYVGRWSIALSVDGRRTVLAGGVWHAGAPSLVWFWLVFVVIACVLAAWRVRSDALDDRVAQGLAIGALIGFATGATAQNLNGRPTVTAVQIGELAVMLAFVGWASWRVLAERAGLFTYLIVAFLALWEGLVLFPVLIRGFPLLALPDGVVRAGAVLCLAAGASLLPLVFRLAGRGASRRSPRTAVRSAPAAPRRERSARS